MSDSAKAVAPTTSRREQIIEVAAALFAERGFHGVSVYDLGAAMGTSGAALYKHFASKEALLGEMLVGISERLLTEGRRRVDAARPDGPEAVLASLVGWHVEFALTRPSLITVQLRDLASLAEGDRHTVRRLQREYVELWMAVLADLHPTRSEADLRVRAHACFGLINSTPHSVRKVRAAPADSTVRGILESMASSALTA
jgi:AcrR family transcriptional regulator